MNKKTKLSPLEVVERYYQKYVEYENAFNNDPFDDSKIQEELKKVLESKKGLDFDSEEFNDAVVSVMVEKPMRRNDVNEAKFFHSVQNGKFVRNEDAPIKVEKERLKIIYDEIKKQM